MENNSQKLRLVSNSLPLISRGSFSERALVPTSPQLATLTVRAWCLGDWTRLSSRSSSLSGNNRATLSSPLSKYDLRVEAGRWAGTPSSMALMQFGVGRGIGRTKNHPKIIGSEVPIAKTRRKSEVFPGKTERAIAEKKKADSPKPDNTNPVKLVLCA
jgi:hypothetical protein